jgi:predicted dinucleotide-binding enzyme
MKIGFIGAGNIGSNAAKLFVNAGHKVAISNSRGGDSLNDLIAELGDNAESVSVEEAINYGDVVFVSIPFGRFKELPVNGFDGKIVIDSDNYYPDRDGHFPELDRDETTSSEMLQEHIAGGSIVKAFNTIWSEHLKTQGNVALPLEDRRVIFMAGDDSKAKETVANLIDEIGFAAVDTGFLAEGGKLQQPGSTIYNKDLTVTEAAGFLSHED